MAFLLMPRTRAATSTSKPPCPPAPAAAAKEAAEQEARTSHHHKHHFTHYVKRVEVALDPQQYPGEAGRFTWDKARHEREHKEALAVRRLGSKPVAATIK